MSKPHSKIALWWYEKRGRVLPIATITVLLLVVAVIAGAFYKGLHKPPTPKPEAPPPVLSTTVVSVTKDARFVKNENGVPRYLLTAAQDTAYSDGRHELEKVVLVSYLPDGKEESKLEADRGIYVQQQGQVECTGNVKLVNDDGAEITTQLLRYDQNTEIASTDQAMQFKRGEVSGNAVGAVYYVKTRVADLQKEAHLIRQHPAKDKPGPPTELTAQRVIYDALKGEANALGSATITQGGQVAKADNIRGLLDVATQKLKTAELRGNSYLKEQTPQKTSEIQSRDMDFFFDERQDLKQAVAVGTAQGRSLENDAPREVKAERIEANYVPTQQGSVLQTLNTQGRTTLKIIAADETQKPDPKAQPPQKTVMVRSSERVLEADSITTTFQADGKFLARLEATGKAIMIITPLQVTPKAERKTLHASKFNAEFFPTKNLLKTAIAEGNAVADFELLMPPPKPTKSNEKPRSGKRTLKAQKLTANLHPETQDVLDMVADGEMKYTDNDRNGTAERGTYEAATQMVTLRGKPLLWDDNARTNADEIDANLDTGESFARGKVRTTYYSRETTGDAAPFKKSKAPVTIAADTATVRHREEAARYQGNARAWQEDDFVRGDNLELDKGESVLHAWGNVQSAFYSVEREVEPVKNEGAKSEAAKTEVVKTDPVKAEPKRKEIVPIFVSADDLVYDDKVRTAHYEGKVKIRQASDQIDAVKADAVMDENKKLSQLTAAQNVILTQPQRRGTGDLLVYTAATDAAVLTGKPAFLEDRERETTSKSPQLTLYLRDARMQSVDETGKKRVRTTHRITPKTNE